MKSNSTFWKLLVALLLFGQVAFGQTVYLTTGITSGSYTGEKWVSITTGPDGTGTVVWQQGNGTTYGNGSGLLTDQAIDLSAYCGTTLYLNAYDEYADGWDGHTYELRTAAGGGGTLLANNGGVSPNGSPGPGGGFGWDYAPPLTNELEVSQAFSAPACPACQAPTGVTSVLTSALSAADISWTASPDETNGYDYYWSYLTTAPTAGTTPIGSVGTGVTTASISGLNLDDNVYVWVRTDCGGSNSAWSVVHQFYTGYCVPSANNVDGSGITLVAFGQDAPTQVSNSTGTETGNYGNFSNLVGNGAQGTTLAVNITNGSGITYDFRIWVDWNDDLDFDDADEMAFYVSQAGSGTVNATVPIPVTATLGNHRMRIAGFDYTLGAGDWCANLSWGCYEDYTLLVTAAPSCPQQPSGLMSALSSETEATISWTAATPAPTGYDYYYNTTGTPPTGTTTPSGSTVHPDVDEDLTGLTAGQTYSFWVRSDCGTGESFWTGPETFYTGYCEPSSTSGSTFINAFSTSGAVSDLSNLGSGYTVGGYADWTAQSVQMYAGGSFTFDLDMTGGTAGIRIWVDWDNDLQFETSEILWTNPGSWVDDQTGISVSVPSGTPLGSYRMRVLIDWTSTGASTVPCSFGGTRGEAEDYTLEVVTPPACTEPSALISSNVLSTSATISWTASPSSPIDGYDYYYSLSPTAPTGTTTPSGSTPSGDVDEDLTGLTANQTYYVWVRTDCGGAGNSAWIGPETFYTGYCQPFNGTSSSSYIQAFTTTGGTSNISNTGSGFSSNGYGNFAGLQTVSTWEGNTVDFEMITLAAGQTHGWAVWVDWNNDLVFDVSERMDNNATYSGSPITGSITVPASTPIGNYRMRVMIDWWPFGVNVNPCSFDSNGPRGEAEDYTFQVIATPPCPDAPSAGVASAVTNSTATIAWTAAASGASNGYDYYYNTTGTAPTGATNPIGQTAAGDLNDDLTGLTGNTTYSFWVRSDCGGGDVSDWDGPYTFTTLCDAVTSFPFLETFETTSTTVGCWTNEFDDGAASWGLFNGDGGNILSAQSGSRNAVFVSQNATNTPRTYLVSPTLDLSGLTNPPRVDFWYGQGDFFGDINAMQVVYRTAPGNPWVVIGDYTAAANTWTNVVLTLPNPSATYQIAFLGINNWGYPNVIDEVLVEETPSCVEPTALTSSNVLSTTATISWTASVSTPIDGYDYYYSTSPTAPTGTTTPIGSTLTGDVDEDLTGLTADMDYYFWVRTDCGSGNYSGWEGPETFRTGYCIPFSTSGSGYVDDFSTTGGAGGDDISNLGTGFTSGGYASYVAQTVSMWEGGSFDFATDITPDAFGGCGVNIWVDWNNDLVFDVSEQVYASGGYVVDPTGTITVPGGTALGNYRMRIRNDWLSTDPDPCASVSDYSEAEDYTLTVVPVPPCPNLPSALTSSNITEDAATISWTAASPAPGNGYDYYYSTSSTPPTGTTTPIGSTVVGDVNEDLTGLSANTVYYYWVRSNCGGGDVSEWAGPHSFLTDAINPLCLEAIGGWPIPDNDCAEFDIVVSAPGVELGNDLIINSVRLNIGHTWDSDLDITLISPLGTQVVLTSDNGGSGDNYGQPNACGSNSTKFIMGEAPITSGSAPFIGSYQPEGDFADFDGEDPNGTWTLEVCDDSGGDVGSIYYAFLEVIPPPTCAAPSGLNLDVVGSTSATISWTLSPSSPQTYNYYLSTSPVEPLSGTTPTGNDGSPNVDFTGLTPSTDYYFWVRAQCSVGDESLWVGPLTFTTAPVNDACVDAILLSCGETVSGTNVAATDLDEPGVFCTTSIDGAGVWYKFVGNGFDATVETCGSSGTLTDTKIHVYTGSCGAFVCEGANDDDCALLSSYTVTSTVAGQTYYVYVTGWGGAIGTFDLVYSTTANEWTGAASTDWSDASNWCSGSVPTIADNAYIPANPAGGNFPSITGDVGVSEIYIASNSFIDVENGGSLTVDNNITNEGTMNIAAQGSLTQPSGSTLGGSGTFNVTKVGSAVYDYWSSPITNAPVGTIGAPYFYNPATGTADPSDDESDPGWIVASGIMNPGQGYASFGAGSRTFSGTANNGPISIGVSSHGLPNVSWNLIGNPYPSGIEFVPFITGNSGILAQAAVYLWDDPGVLPYDPNVQNYAVYSGLGGTAGGGGNTPTSTIAVAQGFKVEVSGTGSINFDNDMRTLENPGLLFRQAEMKRMWLTLSNGNLSDETLIGFAEDGTDGVDWLYDAPALNWMANLTFFSLLDNEPYAIQAYGPFDPNKVVPLGMNAGMQMNASITLSQVDGLEDEDIYLEDRYLGIFHDLNESAYQFDTEAALYMDRFFIHYGASVTDIDELNSNSFGAYVSNDVLNVASQEDLEGRLTIVDATGRMVYVKDNVQLNHTGVKIDLSGVTDGVYIVTFATAETTMTKKVVK